MNKIKTTLFIFFIILVLPLVFVFSAQARNYYFFEDMTGMAKADCAPPFCGGSGGSGDVSVIAHNDSIVMDYYNTTQLVIWFDVEEITGDISISDLTMNISLSNEDVIPLADFQSFFDLEDKKGAFYIVGIEEGQYPVGDTVARISAVVGGVEVGYDTVFFYV